MTEKNKLSTWMDRATLEAFATSIGIGSTNRDDFLADPDAWMQVNKRHDWSYIVDSLDRYWARREV